MGKCEKEKEKNFLGKIVIIIIITFFSNLDGGNDLRG